MKRCWKHHPVRRGRIFFILTLLMFGSTSAHTRQNEGLVVKPAAQSQVEAKPGTILAVTIQVTNTSQEKQIYDAQIRLPHGWRALTRESSFELLPNQSDVRLVTFSVPSETPAGTYQIRYAAKDRASPAHEAEASLDVVVLPHLELELRLVESPRFVIAGKSYTLIFVLTNKGNINSRVRLRTRSANDFPVMVDSSVIHLVPRETRSIELRVVTDTRITEKVQHTVELFTTLFQDTTVSARASSVVDVVPQIAKTEERYLELPVYLKLRTAGQSDRSGGQVEVAGYGTLTQDRSDRLEFLFRGPETQTLSVLGQRDEYRLSYRTKGFQVRVGDWNYSLTPLTEIGRYGTGAGGNVSLGALDVGGYYNQTRFVEPKQKQVAGYLNYRFVEGYQTGLNYLKKSEQAESKIITLRTLAKPWAGNEIDAEYGIASKDTTKSSAYTIRLSGNERWIAYDLRYVQAEADFPGYYKDLNFGSAGVNFQLLTNLRVETYYRDEKRNLSRDTNLVYAPRDRYYQFGMGYSNYVTLYYRVNTQEDLLPNSKYRRQEDIVQARLGYNFEAMSVFANADFGTTQDRLLDKRYPSNRYSLNGSLRPFATQSYNASIEYSKDQNIFNDEILERISGSLSAFIFFGQATQLQLNFYGSRTKASFQQSYGLIEMTLEHIFPFQHKVTLRGRQSYITPSTEESQTAYHLEYAIPLGIPLKRLTTAGQIRGRVLDESGRGIENVLLNAGGSAAITDEKGDFLFPSLKPDVSYLQIDRASMGLDRVTLQLMPMEIVVRGGEESVVEINVIHSSTISGSVILFRPGEQTQMDSAAEPVELQGQAGVFIELSNDTETLRRVTDNRGRFTLTDLRPGRWVLRAAGGEVPLYHVFEKETFEFDLNPGSHESVSFKIIPRKRQIKILQEGSVIQETKPETPKTVQSQPAQAIVLEGIVYKTGSAEITPESEVILEKAFNTLDQHPEIAVEIRGHTDNNGSRSTNMRLSQGRVDAVKAWLVNKGIAADRITTRGYGPDQPIASNTTKKGRQKNRRIEFFRTK